MKILEEGWIESDAGYKRIRRMQRNIELLVAWLRNATGETESEIRVKIAALGGYGEEI